MAVFTLEDLQTAVEVMVFPKTMTDHGHKLADDAVVTVRARVDTREDQPKLIAMEIEPFEPMSGEAFPLRVKVASAALSEAIIEDLKRVLGRASRATPRCSSTWATGRSCACPTELDRGRRTGPPGGAPGAPRGHRDPRLSRSDPHLTARSRALTCGFAG